MKRIVNFLYLSILGLTISSFSWAMDCPDIKKAQVIIKELQTEIKTDLCAKEINEVHLQWIQNTALPRIMHQSFLGAEPPTNWPQLANELLLGCLVKGNLCQKDTQQRFSQCVMVKLPFILYQLGPWMDAHCKQVNRAVIEHWPARKPVIINLINEYRAQFH